MSSRTELYCENMRSPLGDATGEWAVVCRQKNALICSKCEAILCPECAKTGCCCGGDHMMVTMEEFARKLGESEQVVNLIAPLLGGVQ